MTTLRSTLADFQQNMQRHIEHIQSSGQAELLTVNGKAELVVQSAQAYEQLVEEAEFARHIRGLQEGLQEAARGEGRDAQVVFEDIAKSRGIELDR